MKILYILFTIILFSSGSLTAEELGKIIPIKGVPVIHSETDINVTAPTVLQANDRVTTSEGVSAKVVFNDGSSIMINEKTEISFHKTFIKIKKGTSEFKMHKSEKQFKVYTPTVIVGIHGTEFSVRVDDAGLSEIALFEGEIKVTAVVGNKKSEILKPGEKIIGDKGGLGLITTFKVGNVDQVSPAGDPKPVIAEEADLGNLETNGNLGCYFILFRNNKERDLVDTTWTIKVNGHKSLNNVVHAYSGSQKAFISKLDPGCYDFTFTVCGTDYVCSVDLSEENSGELITLLYDILKFKVFIGDMMENMQYEEFLKHLKIFVTFSGKRRELYFHPNDIDLKHMGYHMIVNRGNEIQILYHSDLPKPSRIEIYYDGNVKCKRKSAEIIPGKKNQTYKVRL